MECEVHVGTLSCCEKKKYTPRNTYTNTKAYRLKNKKRYISIRSSVKAKAKTRGGGGSNGETASAQS